jgi:molecular chaperone GrpE
MTRMHDDTLKNPETIQASSSSESSTASSQPPAPGEQRDQAAADLAAQLEEARRLADQYKDQLLRRAAELENFKRRSETEFATIIRNANENLLTALLPVLDDFDRSLKASADSTDGESLRRGIELIAQKLAKVLEREGLVPFESVGQPFDVAYHDALLQLPRADVPPHTVIEEVERGYKLREKVLRHAKVVVSAAADDHGSGTADAGRTAAETTDG